MPHNWVCCEHTTLASQRPLGALPQNSLQSLQQFLLRTLFPQTVDAVYRSQRISFRAKSTSVIHPSHSRYMSHRLTVKFRQSSPGDGKHHSRRIGERISIKVPRPPKKRRVLREPRVVHPYTHSASSGKQVNAHRKFTCNTDS